MDTSPPHFRFIFTGYSILYPCSKYKTEMKPDISRAHTPYTLHNCCHCNALARAMESSIT